MSLPFIVCNSRARVWYTGFWVNQKMLPSFFILSPNAFLSLVPDSSSWIFTTLTRVSFRDYGLFGDIISRDGGVVFQRHRVLEGCWSSILVAGRIWVNRTINPIQDFWDVTFTWFK